MTLDQVLAELRLDVDPEVFAPHWEEDEAALPQTPELLRPEVFLPLREYLRLDAEVEPFLTEVAQRIMASPALKQLWWHCLRLLFHHVDYPGPNMRQWPSLEHLLGEQHGVFYLLAVMEVVSLTQAQHRKRGVPESVAAEGLTGNLQECVGNYKTLNPGRFGVDLRVVYWLRHDSEGELYRLGRIEYMNRPFHGPIQAFRNRRTGETVALAEDGVSYTPEGYVFGHGTETAPGGWTSTLTFTDKSVRGYRISPLGHATQELVELPLDEWPCVLRKGDHVLEMHIPGGGGFTPEKCRESMEQAVAFFRQYFPEQPFVGLGCMSWILNPQIGQIYRPDSNMVLWQQEMYLYPIPSSGRDGLHFLFARDDIDPATAPRDTSMRRAFLDWLASGKRLMSGGAFILTEDLQHYGTQHYRKQR
ncbi:MAG: acyltransferase domain-containing protein [Armatimonadota bacterium]